MSLSAQRRITNNNALLTAAIATALIAAPLATRATAAGLPSGVYVERVGGTPAFGAGAAAGDATTALPVFVDGFSFSGSPTTPQLSLPFATADDSPNGVRALTDIGVPGGSTPSAASFMQASPDKHFLTLAGYDDAAGSAVRTSGGVKTVGVIDTTTGSVSTQLGFSSSAQPRSVATVDGTGYWFIGSANGIRYVTPDPANANNLGTATLISASNVNQRNAAVFGGQLFVGGASSVATNSGSQPGVAFLGTGTPTTATQTQTYIMSTSPNPEQFTLLDLNPSVSFVNGTVDTKLDTAYVGTDNGLEKWAYDGSTWSKQYTLSAGLSADTTSKLFGKILGVTYAGNDSAGHPVLYATTFGNNTSTSAPEGNALVKLVDTGTGSDAFSLVATSPDNTWFRGVQALGSLVTRLPGDVNGDGFVNSGDINAFIFALSHDAAGFASQYPTGIYGNADVNGTNHAGDTFVNAADINPFIAILSGSGEPGIAAALAAVPEPTSLGLLGAGAAGLLIRRRRA